MAEEFRSRRKQLLNVSPCRKLMGTNEPKLDR